MPSEIILRDGHFFRRHYNEVDLGQQQEILQKYIKQELHIQKPIGSRFYHNAICELFNELDCPYEIRKENALAVDFDNKIISVFLKIPALWFTGQYSFNPIIVRAFEKGETSRNIALKTIVPKAAQDQPEPSGGRVTFRKDPIWFPIPNMWFVFSRFYTDRLGEDQSYTQETYLTHKGNNALKRIPYPNVFDDGRICMGESFYDSRITHNPSILDAAYNALELFLKAPMNQDLYNYDNAKNVFLLNSDFKPLQKCNLSEVMHTEEVPLSAGPSTIKPDSEFKKFDPDRFLSPTESSLSHLFDIKESLGMMNSIGPKALKPLKYITNE